MLPREEETTEDDCFSFGSATNIWSDGLARAQKPLGSHDYEGSRSLDLRYSSRQGKGSRNYDDLGKDDHPRHRLFDYPLPVSRSQTMVMYRQEMMARAESMPEGTYELSLRDIVEVPKATENNPKMHEGSRTEQDNQQKDHKGWNRVRKLKERVLGSRRQESSVFLLKMFFPFHPSGKGKPVVVGSKVSPKPISRDSNKSAEETSGSEDMSRSSSKSNSGRRKMSGCYSFLSMHRSP